MATAVNTTVRGTVARTLPCSIPAKNLEDVIAQIARPLPRGGVLIRHTQTGWQVYLNFRWVDVSPQTWPQMFASTIPPLRPGQVGRYELLDYVIPLFGHQRGKAAYNQITEELLARATRLA